MLSFIGLHDLFEKAVRRTIGSLLGPDFRVRKGSDFNSRLFTESTRYDTDPDVVVEGPSRTLVGDVKYKKPLGSSGKLVRSKDVYQLLAHASAFGADGCFTVDAGAGEQMRGRYLGKSPTGIPTWSFKVSPSKLKTQTLALLEEMSLDGILL